MIEVIRSEKNICVGSPYNPYLPSRAKKIGGKWNPTGKCWSFDIRDEARVEELYRSIYGQWDSEVAADAVTVRVTVATDLSEWHSGIFFAGRQVARATGRDSGARLGDGVVILQGGFGSGGSVKNWTTRCSEGTVFEIKDIPLIKVEEERGCSNWSSIEVLGDVDTAALEQERERLLARIAEIDAILNK